MSPHSKADSDARRWFGKLPANWRERPLKFAVHLRNEETDPAEELPYVGLDSIEAATGRLVPLWEAQGAHVPPGGKRFRKGQVLFSKLRPYLAKAFVAEIDGRCTGELLVFEPGLFEPRFLKYCLLSDGFIKMVDASTYGTKMPRAEWDFIGRLRMPLPKVETQKSIADHLDRETARIDELVAEKEKMLALLEEKRNALVTRAVTRGLDPNAKMKDSGVEWLPEIPSEWNIIRLKHLAAIYYGLSQPPEYRNEGIPFVRATNVKKGQIVTEGLVFVDEADLPSSRVIHLNQGDVIVVRSGAYTGDSGLVTEEWVGAVAGYDMVLRFRPSVVPAFLQYALLSPYVLNAQIDPLRMRAAQPHLNAEELGDVSVVLPPLAEQRAIVEALSAELAEARELEAALKESIRLLSERRAALITAAVTGQFGVTGAN